MDKNTVYILQKDLPYVKAGVEYKFDGEHYVCDETSKFTTDIYSDRLHKKSVENNLEWFKPKEEVNESNHTEQFQWTNELVSEYVENCVKASQMNENYVSPETFIQSKSKKEEPQWEILEFKGRSTGFIYKLAGDMWMPESETYVPFPNTEEGIEKSGTCIHSVKRFPDNTVWSVDMVTGQGKIKAFNIIGKNMVVEIYEFGCILSIDSLTEAPKEEQVPIKVEGIMEIGLGQPQDKKGKIYMLTLVGNSKIPYEKVEPIKKAIEDVLNCKPKGRFDMNSPRNQFP